MKKLVKGDTFHHPDYAHDPYTVIEVTTRDYVLNQDGEESRYKHKIIHDLFNGRQPWTLNRNTECRLPEELFTL